MHYFLQQLKLYLQFSFSSKTLKIKIINIITLTQVQSWHLMCIRRLKGSSSLRPKTPQIYLRLTNYRIMQVEVARWRDIRHSVASAHHTHCARATWPLTRCHTSHTPIRNILIIDSWHLWHNLYTCMFIFLLAVVNIAFFLQPKL